MMKFHILTLFPEMVQQGLATSILGRAAEKKPISIDAGKIRDYTQDKHGKVDDYTYGGGAGLDLKLYGEFVPGTDSWLTLSVMNTGMKVNGRRMPLPTDQRFAAHLFYTDFFPGSDRWLMTLRLTYASNKIGRASCRERV